MGNAPECSDVAVMGLYTTVRSCLVDEETDEYVTLRNAMGSRREAFWFVLTTLRMKVLPYRVWLWEDGEDGMSETTKMYWHRPDMWTKTRGKSDA